MCLTPLASQVQALQTVKNDKGETVTGHIISTTIGGKNGEPKRVSALPGWLNVLRASGRDLVLSPPLWFAVSSWLGRA
jgi:hypothetical protein